MTRLMFDLVFHIMGKYQWAFCAGVLPLTDGLAGIDST